jgi:hypothetical protein
MKIYAPDRKSFTIIDNAPVNDPALSPCALGMLVYLWSKPDGWEVLVSPLAHRFRCGKNHIYSCLTLLEQAGYLTRERLHTGSMEYRIYERSIHDNPRAELKPKPEKPDQGIQDAIINTDYQQTLSKRLSNKQGRSSNKDTSDSPSKGRPPAGYLQ